MTMTLDRERRDHRVQWAMWPMLYDAAGEAAEELWEQLVPSLVDADYALAEALVRQAATGADVDGLLAKVSAAFDALCERAR